MGRGEYLKIKILGAFGFIIMFTTVRTLHMMEIEVQSRTTLSSLCMASRFAKEIIRVLRRNRRDVRFNGVP